MKFYTYFEIKYLFLLSFLGIRKKNSVIRENLFTSFLIELFLCNEGGEKKY